MTKIKICGLSRIEDIESVNAVLPDYIGFVFAESKRKVSYEQARYLKDLLDERIRVVGVFVNAGIKDIVNLYQKRVVDLVQLHGDEDEKYIEALKAQISCPVVKAVRVKSEDEIKKARDLPVNYLLLDTYQKDLYGGSGKVFDWSLISGINKPFFLAGGLNSGNIKSALKYRPYCLDISSGVETEGKKDGNKIKELVRLVRSEM